MAPGRLYGLGVGPGDPELITLKALRLLRAAPVVAYPATENGDSIARQIVAEWLQPRQREIAIRFPTQPGPPPAAIYRDAAAVLADTLDCGLDVAYVCQGDSLLYGSFAGILAELPQRCPVTIVPGVSSITACAAAAATPLVQRDEVLSVIPATLPEAELRQRLANVEAAAVVKLGRSFAKLRRVLAVLGLLETAVYVERASWPNQRVAPLSAIDPASVPYFAMALIRRGPTA